MKSSHPIPPRKKKVPARVQYKDYADYLKSPKWKQVKEDYKKNEQIDYCLCCGVDMIGLDIRSNFHHFKYPKDWNDDSLHNLIIVCEDCHNVLHQEHDHNSDPISLRDYMFKIALIQGNNLPVIESISREQYYKNLWNQAEGRFCINQEGISDYKTMKADLLIRDQGAIETFIKKRDELIAKDSE